MNLYLYQELESLVNGVEVGGEARPAACYRAKSRTGEIIIEDRKDSENLLPSPLQVWPMGDPAR